MKAKTSKQKAQAAMREWLKSWGIAISPVVAADLVARVEAAIEAERRAVLTRLMEPPTPDHIAKVAEVTIRKHAASPLTSTPELWERIVRTILEADRAMIRAAMETGK